MKTTKSILGLGAALMALTGGILFAQTNNTNTSIADTDKTYLIKDAQGSVYDFETAELAVEMARSPRVQKYALMLLDDHARLNKELLLLANRKSIQVPVTLGPDDQPKLTALEQKSGTEFDSAYIEEAIRINTEDVQDANKELNATTDPDVRKVVGNYLKTEQKHLDEARNIQQSMTAAK